MDTSAEHNTLLSAVLAISAALLGAPAPAAAIPSWEQLCANSHDTMMYECDREVFEENVPECRSRAESELAVCLDSAKQWTPRDQIVAHEIGPCKLGDGGYGTCEAGVARNFSCTDSQASEDRCREAQQAASRTHADCEYKAANGRMRSDGSFVSDEAAAEWERIRKECIKVVVELEEKASRLCFYEREQVWYERDWEVAEEWKACEAVGQKCVIDDTLDPTMAKIYGTPTYHSMAFCGSGESESAAAPSAQPSTPRTNPCEKTLQAPGSVATPPQAGREGAAAAPTAPPVSPECAAKRTAYQEADLALAAASAEELQANLNVVDRQHEYAMAEQDRELAAQLPELKNAWDAAIRRLEAEVMKRAEARRAYHAALSGVRDCGREEAIRIEQEKNEAAWEASRQRALASARQAAEAMKEQEEAARAAYLETPEGRAELEEFFRRHQSGAVPQGVRAPVCPGDDVEQCPEAGERTDSYLCSYAEVAPDQLPTIKSSPPVAIPTQDLRNFKRVFEVAGVVNTVFDVLELKGGVQAVSDLSNHGFRRARSLRPAEPHMPPARGPGEYPVPETVDQSKYPIRAVREIEPRRAWSPELNYELQRSGGEPQLFDLGNKLEAAQDAIKAIEYFARNTRILGEIDLPVRVRVYEGTHTLACTPGEPAWKSAWQEAPASYENVRDEVVTVEFVCPTLFRDPTIREQFLDLDLRSSEAGYPCSFPNEVSELPGVLARIGWQALSKALEDAGAPPSDPRCPAEPPQ